MKVVCRLLLILFVCVYPALGAGTVDTTLQNFLFGVQVKNNITEGPRFKPFGNALIGFAVQQIDIGSPQDYGYREVQKQGNQKNQQGC